MQETNDQKKKYDLLFILSPLLPEDKVVEEVARMTKIIEEHNGSIFESETPKVRALSYPVAKTWEGKKGTFDQGYFGTFKVEIPSGEVPAVHEALRSFQYLLRFALTDAYLDVRPVRRIPGTEEKAPEATEAGSPVEVLVDPVVPVEKEEIVVPEVVVEKAEEETKTEEKVEKKTTKKTKTADEVPAKKPAMTEEEIDKQIESLLS